MGEELLIDPPYSSRLASLLRRKSEIIIQNWAARVRSEICETKDLPVPRLINSFPLVLENLAHYLESAERMQENAMVSARLHGKERALLPLYTVGQVISEYRILRQSILEEVGEFSEASSREQNRFIEGIEMGMSEAASSFTQDQYNIRDQFISLLAHDLRNPLTAARSSAQLIIRYPEDLNTVSVLAARIMDSTTRADRLIQDLLDLNRMRAGENIPLKIENLDLRNLIHTTLEDISSIAGAITEFIPPTEPVIGYWDAGLLKRAIENLVVNAKKYGDSSFPVKISIRKTSEGVHIAVQNKGTPIAPSEQLKIFDPFQRGKSANNTKGAGWGLGLSFIENVSRAHGGRASVESDEKNGTTFIITLPMDARAHQDSRAA